MLDALPVILTGLAVLAPAAFVLWQGRRIAQQVNDPLLPERLLAHRRRTGMVTGACVAGLVPWAPSHLLWALPLLMVTRAAAAYPLRRALYGETWSLAAYLSFSARWIAAAFGFWLSVMAMPYLIELAGSWDWFVAPGFLGVLVAWSAFHAPVFLAIVRARPIEDPELIGRFARMLAECGLPAVRLEQVDLRGGMFANAVALPSTRWPAVLVSSTLVERFDHDETAAVLAHELAHIEYYNPRRLRRTSMAAYTLIAAGALLPPLLHATAPGALNLMAWIWPLVVVAFMIVRVQHRQAHETASDLRAVALTGDGEPLIRALSKLHAFARVPRRWDTEFERHATHPSLARRIQAIRGAAGAAPVLLGEAATFAGAAAGSSVTFQKDRVTWSEGAAVSHTIDYGHLTMLRVDARASGDARLVAVDREKRRWEIPLRTGDIARIQATLDIVDARLGATAAPPILAPALVRILAAIAVAASMTFIQLPVVFVGWLAVSWPTPSLLAASGAALLASAPTVGRDRPELFDYGQPWMAIVAAVCGAMMLAVAVAKRRERAPAIASGLTLLLAVSAVAFWAPIVTAGTNAIDMHRAARQEPSAATLTLALAGALAFERRRVLRYGSAVAAVAGVSAMALGSTAFLDRFGRDPFLADAPPVEELTVPPTALSEFSVRFQVGRMWLSPAAGAIALASEDRDEKISIHAGRVGGPLADFEADDAVFVDERRLLLIEEEPGLSILRVVDLGMDDRETWRLRVPIESSRLWIDRTSATWRLLGSDSNGDIARAEGRIGDDSVRSEGWTALGGRGGHRVVLSASGGQVLALETTHDEPVRRHLGLQRLAPLVEAEPSETSQFWAITDRGREALATSRLSMTCGGAVAGDEETICAAYDGTRTHLVVADPATRTVRLRATAVGRVYLNGEVDEGWIVGWWDWRPALFRPATRQAIRAPSAERNRVTQLAVSGKRLAVASVDGRGSIVRIYALD